MSRGAGARSTRWLTWAPLFDHGQQPLWTWRNGYALGSAEGLARVSRLLAAASAAEIDHLRGLLRIRRHWDVDVTDAQ